MYWEVQLDQTRNSTRRQSATELSNRTEVRTGEKSRSKDNFDLLSSPFITYMDSSETSHHRYVHLPPPSAAGATMPYTLMPPYQTPNPTPYPSQQPSIYHPPIHNSPLPPAYPSAASSTVFYPPPTSSNVNFPQPDNIINPPISQPTYHFSSNTPTPIDDYMRKLRDEVIFLHRLWHQGPPDFTTNPNSIDDPVKNTHFHLKPCHSTSFKRVRNNPLPQPVSDNNPWPVPPDPPAPPMSESGWPQFPPRPTPQPPVFTDEDRARFSAIRAQQNALGCFRSLFAVNNESVSDSESDDDGSRAKFDRFMEVFEGDEELKGYYEKNWGNGEFLCLVCGGTGQMVGRKYKNCVALVQHTITISNTKKKAAHREYGEVICKVLGWKIDQLPLLSRDLSIQQGNDISSAEAGKDDHVGVETNIASSVNRIEQSDPSKTTDVGKDDSAEKKESSDVPSITNISGKQEFNDTSNAAQNTVAFVDERGLSVLPKDFTVGSNDDC